ncbi:glycoside hydrolase family 76 [Luteibacter rhizovicinus DSM 16549]|uniref:Glycoside hydrolase family 76 n=1 Tax=Luteibacter rhizovicinus DSM 16549 TaxID=1440763 RepID=A0A0G9HHD2_9GAMM|nr:glycoside hydrolase family 76 protein [Luteibacter rhizovicinus]APG05525.1 glycoside hydrolase family 76 [Luteibacter rhizovicinus DSM 16549]KLD67077.1 glycoside hydrolase family 76 [Luteibacter rhizovicinus DSM 16549]
MKPGALRIRVRTLLAVASLTVMAVSFPSAAAEQTPLPLRQSDGPTAMARARVAADVLMNSYEPDKAWFPSSWWNSAVALQTVGDYMERTGDRRYLGQLNNTFEKDKGVFPAGVLSGDPLLGNFTSRAIDDSEWWGLTWLQAYDLTRDPKYLNMAVTIADYVNGYWDTGTCGGGVWWDGERTYKNAIVNGLWIRLTAELHNRIPGDTLWLGRSRTAWAWFQGSGMINANGLVNDGLTNACTNNGQNVWSYNQGLAIGAGLELWRATRDPQILNSVRRLADAAIGPDALVTEGVLSETCDAADQTCDDNAKQFKGIFMRYWTDLVDTTHERRYAAFLDQQATNLWQNDRDAAGRFGTRWSGATNDDHPNVFDWRTQASALSALIGDVPTPTPLASLAATLSPAQPVVMPAASGVTSLPLALGASATGYFPLLAIASVDAPAGWNASPRASVLRLQPRGNALPVSTTQPLKVTVPAAATDGHHLVTVNLLAAGLRFTTQADVLVAHTIDFDTGTVNENPWLFDAGGSQSNGVQNRFADGNAHFTYRFPFPADTTSAHVTLTIDAEFLVQASTDNEHWTTVLQESQPVTDGSNKADRNVDLTPYLGAAADGSKPVYLKVSDAFPNDGWGGRVYHVTANIVE